MRSLEDIQDDIPNKDNNPNGKCHCGKIKSRHENDEVKACKLSKYANSGEIAGTRHRRS